MVTMIEPSEIVTTLRAAGCVFGEDEATLLLAAARTPLELRTMVERRVAGLPLEHILGWVEFCGLRICVDPGVFVPRQRTAFMVERAVALAGPDAAVLDLCCGAGAIGVAIAARLPRVELFAADIDPAAVVSARRNMPPHGRVFEGDLFDPLPAGLRGRIDIIVANTPYVPSEAIGLMPPEARLHEARIALDGGPDGLDVQRRVAAEAPHWLAPGGRLFVETSEEQAELTAEIFAANGLQPTVEHSEEHHSTVVSGRRAA
jgi:release factor glutamine methyltransferase